VTANTRHDGEEFLALAAKMPIRCTTTEYPFEKADLALEDLANDAGERRSCDPCLGAQISGPEENTERNCGDTKPLQTVHFPPLGRS